MQPMGAAPSWRIVDGDIRPGGGPPTNNKPAQGGNGKSRTCASKALSRSGTTIGASGSLPRPKGARTSLSIFPCSPRMGHTPHSAKGSHSSLKQTTTDGCGRRTFCAQNVRLQNVLPVRPPVDRRLTAANNVLAHLPVSSDCSQWWGWLHMVMANTPAVTLR